MWTAVAAGNVGKPCSSVPKIVTFSSSSSYSVPASASSVLGRIKSYSVPASASSVSGRIKVRGRGRGRGRCTCRCRRRLHKLSLPLSCCCCSSELLHDHGRFPMSAPVLPRSRGFQSAGHHVQVSAMDHHHHHHPSASYETATSNPQSGLVSASESSWPSGYQLPPDELRKIADAPPTPALSVSPHRDKILFLSRRSLPQLSEIARPEEKLAGIRIDKNCNSRSRMSFYTGISICRLTENDSLGPELKVFGFPDGSKINFVSWSRDGQHIAFSVRFDQDDGSSSKMNIWVADVRTGEARPLFGKSEIYLNTIFDNFAWIDDSTLVVCTIPSSRGNPPERPQIPSSPKIQSNEANNVVQVRTYKDLLKDEYDSDLFDYYATTQLLWVRLDGTMKLLGPPAIYTSINPSPDGKYLLVSSLHRPYSYIVPYGRFPKKVELWTSHGKFVREICDLPLAEDIPIAFDSVRKGKRSINWRSDKPSTLYWVETQDGGDAKVKVSPRDIIYTETAELQKNIEPEILHKLDLRYRGISWGDDSLALAYESWYKTRRMRMRTWMISPAKKQEASILFDQSSEDVYSDPGSALRRRTSLGTYVLAKIRKEDGNTCLLLKGRGARPEGNVPFLDLLDINTGVKERIWESDKDHYYETLTSLMSDQHDGDLELNKLKMIFSKESRTEIPQLFLKSWPDKTSKQITDFPHPYPQLEKLRKEMIRYTCKDGVQLTATLYLPPEYDAVRDGPLPMLVWANPGEFKSKDAASQVRVSPHEFRWIRATSPLIFLARGIAILFGPRIPIIGEGDEEANGRYVEQLVSSTEAVVEEALRRGVAHPKKIAIAGHSYGAFMTANLLAHAPHLFSCGIARSGAYNRTLTPFGFQNEERTLWEATSTYIEMSPYMLAHKIKKPILLVHGEEDSNPRTLPMQSERFFSALKGHGCLCRLVVLPFESHDYSSRESIMHLLWETDTWLQKYCVNQKDDNAVVETDTDGLAKKLLVAGNAGHLREHASESCTFHQISRSFL